MKTKPTPAENLHSSKWHQNAKAKIRGIREGEADHVREYKPLFKPHVNCDVTEYHPSNTEAMSHNDVLKEILYKTIPALVVHAMDRRYPPSHGVYWYMDSHWHRKRPSSKYDTDRSWWCECCWARVTMDPEKSCQFCRTGWIMSTVSPAWRDLVLLFGMEASRYWWEWPAAHRANKMAEWKYGPTGKPSGDDGGDGDGDGQGGDGRSDGKGEGEDGTGDDKGKGSCPVASRTKPHQ